MTEVKICGVNSADAFDAAAGAGADWVGFVFVPASPRAVTPSEAAALARRIAGGPGRVGLFVTPDDEAVRVTLDAVALDALQVYAGPERAMALQNRFGLPVWRAIGIASPADLPGEAAVARLLLDASAPNAVLPGGNAHAFDWAMLRGWRPPAPWVLAGGLTPANVAAAIRISGAPTVDVSSGVERTRGVKDPALIRSFIAAVKSNPSNETTARALRR